MALFLTLTIAEDLCCHDPLPWNVIDLHALLLHVTRLSVEAIVLGYSFVTHSPCSAHL